MGRNPFNRNVYGRRKLLFRNELHKSYKRARRLDSRFHYPDFRGGNAHIRRSSETHEVALDQRLRPAGFDDCGYGLLRSHLQRHRLRGAL